MGQRTLLVGQREHHAGLVGLRQRAQQVGLVGIAHHQEARKIVLVVLDVVLQHLQTVKPRGLGMADGGPPAPALLGYHLGGAGGVLGLHILQLRVAGQKVATLHQGHGVRVYLADGAPVVAGQTADAMGDVQLMLAHNGGARIAQQLVVVQQRTGYGVLNGRHAYHRGVLLQALKHLLKRGAALQLYLLALEVEVGGYVVKRARQSLYRYSLHTIIIYLFLSTSPAFTLSVKRDPYFCLSSHVSTYIRSTASQSAVK